jgi:Tfp pilus assembly protein FimT
VAIPPAAPAEPVDAEEKAKELEARTRDVAPPPVVAANAPPKNLANAEAAGASSFRNQKTETANLRQRFSQTARGQALRSNAKFKQAANVLNTFQVEQDGRQIRVVDEDGSTYTGKLETVGQDAARSRAEGKTTAAAPAARSAVMREKDSASGENELYFRATGYNASLKKQVVFEGNYITPPATAPNPSDQKTDEQAPARIIGKAKVPGEAPVEIDAIAVRR